MKSHDELMAMSDEEKLSYLDEEVEKVISNAEPKMQLKLRAIQARANGIRRRIKDKYTCADVVFRMMVESLHKLNNALNGK